MTHFESSDVVKKHKMDEIASLTDAKECQIRISNQLSKSGYFQTCFVSLFIFNNSSLGSMQSCGGIFQLLKTFLRY